MLKPHYYVVRGGGRIFKPDTQNTLSAVAWYHCHDLTTTGKRATKPGPAPKPGLTRSWGVNDLKNYLREVCNVTDPYTEQWEATLPNGVVIGNDPQEQEA
jgi:hypothetical protein